MERKISEMEEELKVSIFGLTAIGFGMFLILCDKTLISETIFGKWRKCFRICESLQTVIYSSLLRYNQNEIEDSSYVFGIPHLDLLFFRCQFLLLFFVCCWNKEDVSFV